MPDRVVFDTNIWISGLIWRGNPYCCLQLAYAGLVQPAICSSMLAELCEKLRSKFGFNENRIQRVVYDVRRVSTEVAIKGDLSVVTADPADDKFVECAIVGEAPFIVSHDKHLLTLGTYRQVRVLSAEDYLALFASSR
jgi:putative PIN family toxin of toxin-antitoxin system